MATKIKPVIFGNWWRGIGTSKYDEAYFADIVNADILTEVGTIRCQRAIAKNSGTSVSDSMLRAVTPSGTTYYFSTTSGTIVKRSNSGTYSSVTANSNTTGHLGAGFYNGYVYYATATKLGRFVPETEGDRNDSFQTFAVGDPAFHPMTVHNLKLFVGDGNKVASIDSASAFNSSAMGTGLESQYRITDIQRYGNDLLICTGVSSYIAHSGIFRWDTFSASWTDEDYIDEPFINYAIYSDTTDIVFISAGTKGNIYLYDGTKLSFYTNIPYSSNIGQQLKSSFERRPLFAVQGRIYSITSPQRSMAPAVNHEYTVSAGASAIIYSIAVVGSNILVSWKNGTDYGIDALSDNYAVTSFTTPIVSNRKNIDVRIPFDLMPSGCSLTLETNVDNAGFVAKALVKDAADMNMFRLDGHLANHRTVQARVTLNPNGTTTPVVPHIEFW